MTGAAGPAAKAHEIAVSVCRRAYARIEPALRAAVDRLPRHLALMSGYHLGWWGPGGDPAERARTGKAVRPALTFLAAEALGAPPRYAVPGAVAVELVHNFALVHDDIMDGDTTRRGRPTVWQQYGTGAALLTGDGLYVLAADTLAAPHTPRSTWAVTLLTRAMLATLHGQASDHAFTRAPWSGPGAVTLADYPARQPPRPAPSSPGPPPSARCWPAAARGRWPAWHCSGAASASPSSAPTT
ncbi:polyprenyl synthetase family protein [Streptomyces albus]